MAGKHLSWNEIKNRALAFSKEWADESSEHAEAKSFWDGFFNVFGVTRRRIASFEQNVKKIDGRDGFIDLLWKGVLLIEHKSRGKDLDRAHTQAVDYFPGLKEHELPRYIMVSDFARFRLYDLDEREEYELLIEDFHKNVNLFGFIAGYQTRKIKPQDPVNIKAAEKMGKLHDQMKAVGYEGHALELYLVRLLFCLYAEDTAIFEKQQFSQYIEDRTSEDGSDLASHMSQLFEVLNTSEDKRLKNLDEHLAAFPHINGKLFDERLPHAGFDAAMRDSLLECCALDWSKISPAIFGSFFQSIMDKDARRNLGAHYTSEENILKLINPLFMDELNEELDRISKLVRNTRQLNELHDRIRSLKFLDPACGCGNFLIIAYRELRLLELKILRELNKHGVMELDIGHLIQVDVDQFYGIEIEEFPAQIAQVAMWLMDHQMNLLVSKELGQYFARLPLKKAATIVHGNALLMDWEEIIPKTELNYILGNPPFIGHQWRNQGQMKDMDTVFGKNSKTKRLDYVAAWYFLAAKYIKQTKIRGALVSTNSITQGEQVPILWKRLFNDLGVSIHFAHQTFRWTNEAPGNAGVHVVIIGFGTYVVEQRALYEYYDQQAQLRHVENINGYLTAGPNVFIVSRSKPIHKFPSMFKGSQPTDGGHLILDASEKEQLIQANPQSEKWIRRYMGGADFIKNQERYCLWLKDCPPNKLQEIPLVLERLRMVAKSREESPTKSVQEYAKYPSLFTQDRQPDSEYLCIPEVSSISREYIPIGFLGPDIVCSNKLQIIPDASLYMFGILTSRTHMSWMRYVGGRLKSDYSYSPAVYHNFPWPHDPSDVKVKKIEECSQLVLDLREKYPDSSLADLYDPLTMPPDLLRAHQTLDNAVDSTYGRTAFKSEAERVSFLFDLYQEYVGE